MDVHVYLHVCVCACVYKCVCRRRRGSRALDPRYVTDSFALSHKKRHTQTHTHAHTHKAHTHTHRHTQTNTYHFPSCAGSRSGGVSAAHQHEVTLRDHIQVRVCVCV